MKATHTICGTSSRPVTGGVLTGKDRSDVPGDSAHGQPDAPVSQQQRILHSGSASPQAFTESGKAWFRSAKTRIIAPEAFMKEREFASVI